MTTIKCIPVEVYRNVSHDRTNKGVTYRYDTLYLAHPDGPECIDVDEGDNLDRLLCIIDTPDSPHAISFYEKDAMFRRAERENDDRLYGPFFGGNFVFSGSPLFPSACPIPVWDRYENAEESRRRQR